MIYASLRSDTLNNNPKTTDLTGMFLKEVEDKEKSTIFQKFSNLNAECKIEFILTSIVHPSSQTNFFLHDRSNPR